ncbi:PD-(D/E)XK nuclease family protein [Billgrantia kenyensis]|uniref:PD-(D/E)XK nuclease family protein n=1 Tax=Billgrantia kenyensis TaxID=321266 RepID=A0A7V9W4X2_9GAMM|nr:PD-(D/E)XK nuclease family protein [Halomonas kenyensis]MBA2781114.1 PD-(D/E)XK nuclease family protein [Halomonas kenyensis]MCG6659938.1 hypothetical protein [Halomonas kenyensis]
MVEHLPVLNQAALDSDWGPAYLSIVPASLYGDVSARRHAFAVEGLNWGIRLSEPQVTSALVNFLSPTVFTDAGPRRCAALVRALYRAAGRMDERLRLDPLLATPGTLEVAAERRTGDRRIDIAIEWFDGPTTDKTSRRLVLIECKFDHHITSKQLPAYRQYAQRQTAEGGYALFLLLDRLTSRTTRSIARNKDWQPVTWLAVLRYLEQELIQEPDEGVEDFACLRRTIWNMAKNRTF